MLWVEMDLRRQSSKVWCEEGLNALEGIKVFNYTVFSLKGLFSCLFLKGPILKSFIERVNLFVVSSKNFLTNHG
jgi:hypothetical protein